MPSTDFLPCQQAVHTPCNCPNKISLCRGFVLTESGDVVNPTKKPLLELEFLLRVCHQGGWLVDLCCGSGSGLIAGLRLGYNVAGFDIREAQVAATTARIRKLSAQEVNEFATSFFI